MGGKLKYRFCIENIPALVPGHLLVVLSEILEINCGQSSIEEGTEDRTMVRHIETISANHRQEH